MEFAHIRSTCGPDLPRARHALRFDGQFRQGLPRKKVRCAAANNTPFSQTNCSSQSGSGNGLGRDDVRDALCSQGNRIEYSVAHIVATSLNIGCQIRKIRQGNFYLRRSNAGLWIIIGRRCCLSVCLCESSQGSLYRPEKHGNIGN